ncbi:MAG: hypothetical protein ABJB55_10015 [Actinomycetota bacterium]
MEQITTCPECGSAELRETKRVLDSYTEVKVMVCGVCHWASDPRVGRPPADRGKNVTLRRLISDATSNDGLGETSDESL